MFEQEPTCQICQSVFCVSNIESRIYKYGVPLQGILMAWTLHGQKEIKTGLLGVGALNKEKIASHLWSNMLPVCWHHINKPFVKK